ncbi:MAG: ABC transporter permease [Candidatus Schekmanbacteria bacterium GWA2_38_9]|uniref:ABC transporter permease n=1 Tax=Candidatus Schekmanbacteria bacterium RIFCSPLOWO2_12_FULL_38_15 TaxID=1817883 RepID=A0A1F7SEE7_9BACT|nr:MAG: ABC transporter permease [Candidatus Schekmanbacteria bacterium GWA2_38_9]OGL49105.1 MAG: ABC transporter permease [Candidatus Schekmanbacteria bacterium RIFCSPLOWO2_02_FULL_38_14]OGL52081.1 MAG: ABC transporter permease [Candidatus Schekmanbacteria bacterium RIFCSPLOWO2_12_FULL_38_15]
MNYISEGFLTAIKLIISFDSDVYEVVFLSLRVSIIAAILSSLVGMPLGFLIATKEFRGKKITITVFNTLMALPTVVVGLFVYSLISRKGPLGVLDLLFTPRAIIIGEFILATPIIIALSISAIQGIDSRVKATAMTLGANPFQVAIAIVSEARFAILAAIIAGYGRVIAELGSALMLGGNIKGYTRTMATAIGLETSKGEFGFALAIGFILLIVAFSINISLQYIQQKRK